MPQPQSSPEAGASPEARGLGALLPKSRLLRYLLVHALIGAGLALAFVAALLWLDIGGIGRMIFTSPNGPIALALLIGGMTVTMAGVVMAGAIMMLGEGDGGADRGKRAPAPAQTALSPARAVAGGRPAGVNRARV